MEIENFLSLLSKCTAVHCGIFSGLHLIWVGLNSNKLAEISPHVTWGNIALSLFIVIFIRRKRSFKCSHYRSFTCRKRISCSTSKFPPLDIGKLIRKCGFGCLPFPGIGRRFLINETKIRIQDKIEILGSML